MQIYTVGVSLSRSSSPCCQKRAEENTRRREKQAEGEEAECVKDVTLGEGGGGEENTREEMSRQEVCLTSVGAVCRGQAQAAVQEAEGRKQALCVAGLQPPC